MFSRRGASLARVRNKNARLQAEVSLLLSKLSSVRDLQEEVDFYGQRLPDSTAEVDRHRGLLISVRDSLTDGLLSSGNQV